MAVSKNSKTNRGTTAITDRTYVKFVRKANMWAKTTFTAGKQKIEWFSKGDKPNE